MSSTRLIDLLEQCRQRLHERGFNLWGTTAISDYDAAQCRGGRLSELQKGGRSAIVVGAGGRGLWEQLRAEGRLNGGPRRGYHPVDGYSAEVLLAEAEGLRAEGYEACAVFPFDRNRVNFLRLAESAGLGVISPAIPFLLHPEYGPWVSLRGALVLNASIPASVELRDFDPCSPCPSPCLKACPVSAYEAGGGTRLDRCADHRHAGGCHSGCDVRRACHLGQNHRFAPDEEEFRHAYSLPMLRRYYGLGWWGLVPTWLRR